MRDGSFEEQSVLEQSFDLLEYLSAVAREIGPRPVRDARSHTFTLWPAEVPELRGVVAVGPTAERAAWLEVRRLSAPDAAPIPDSLADLLLDEAALTDPSRSPEISDAAVSVRVSQTVAHELGEPPADDEDDPRSEERQRLSVELREELQDEFWMWADGPWAVWAARTRPVVAARGLYARLYELHLRADVDSATHEVVWGHLLLSCQTREGAVLAPMLTTAVTVHVDPEDATIRVLAEQTVELELDALEGTGLSGVDGLVALQSALRASPPDPWSDDERQTVRRQLIAPLGVDAVLHDSLDPAGVTRAPQVNDGWLLFMRKRPLRQERFYDELAHKIRAEKFLPEALASVVADADRVDQALTSLGREIRVDDGSADRLLMPLPTNAEQERIARQLARSRGVTVQGPPGTGKSHTIVNLVSHLVAQGKRVLVTAEKEQALAVLRDKIPPQLRDLSIAVLGSTPAALEDLRSSAQAMQDSLSAIDLEREARRITELGETIDALRDSLARTDAALVEALRSEQREYPLPQGPARAPQVAEWLADDRHLDLIEDTVPDGSALPLTPAELTELTAALRSVSADDARAAVLDLPVEPWLPSAPTFASTLSRLDALRAKVTALEDSGLRVDGLDALTLDDLQRHAADARDEAATMRSLGGEWEDRLASAARGGDPSASWLTQHNLAVVTKIASARELASRLAGHVVAVPDGNPVAQLGLVQEWSARVTAGKKVSLFSSRELRELSAHVQVDGYAATTVDQLELVRTQIQLRSTLREVHVLMSQAYAPCAIPVPPLDGSFLFVADQLAGRVQQVVDWWVRTYPNLSARLRPLVTVQDPALQADSLERVAALFDDAAARLEERQMTRELNDLRSRVAGRSGTGDASALWSTLLSSCELGRADLWGAALDDARRLLQVRSVVLRADELASRIANAGAPRWSRAIVESRGDVAVVGEPEEAHRSWARARARTWLLELHAGTDVESLMDRAHSDSRLLREAIVDMAARSARVQLKRNQKDRQRRALETWLTAVKKVGKGTGKNAPRFHAAARAALPAAMGAVPIWIMPIYRVMENFDPRVSDLFDVVVVDESSQCDLLSLGVLALGKKTVVVGDDKQTTPERVGIQVERIAALQDQHLRALPEAKLLTLDESLYSISGRAFPSTIALREHFRCVPEIIGFSNRYYNGAIRPLREVGVPQIGDPLRVVRVNGAVSVDRGAGRVNPDEAVAIADQVAACIADPAYDGLTFGVVTMMSGPQSQRIQDLIRERIGDDEFEQRRLRVGNPPMFQGDERNVIFVSMVAHDASFAATTARYAQWANVAASRAQDQLWVFHSMEPATLHHEDQRRAMIEYAQGSWRGAESLDLFERTESKFERDVLRQILERGYDVIPQHRVGSYRIDFVVRVAPGERLAVECDGDAFHGPDKWDDDVRRQRVLERLGWTFWRIRASKYYLDPAAAMESLWKRLGEMRSRAAEMESGRRARQEAAERQRLEALREQAARTVPASTTVGEPVRQTAPDQAPDAGAGTTHAPRVRPTHDLRRSAMPASIVRGAPQPSAPREPDAGSLREWARANGFVVSERGRLPQEVKAAFEEAQRQTRESVQPVPRTALRTTGVTAPPSATLEPPSRDDVEAAWRSGLVYQLDVDGDIAPRNDGRTLAGLIGRPRADALRDRMQAVRPQGGRFKVDASGLMVTLVDGEPTFVTWVRRDEWFPAHWQ